MLDMRFTLFCDELSFAMLDVLISNICLLFKVTFLFLFVFVFSIRNSSLFCYIVICIISNRFD